MGFKSSQGSGGAGKRLTTYATNLIGSSAGGAGGSAAAGPGIAAITATGGTITTVVGGDGKTYKLHTFTTVGIDTFTVSSADPTATVNVICLSGGNGGNAGPGNDPSCPIRGPGGPSGTFAHFQNVSASTPGSRTVTVGGAGGPGAITGGTSSFIFSPGTPNSINLSCLPLTNPGGVPGSIVMTPSSGIILNHAVRITGGPGEGGQGFGGDVLPAIDSQSNILYNAPISGYGGGGRGGGQGGGSPNPGTPGSGGFVRVYYQIPA